MAKYDAAELLATMKRRGLVPTNQGTFTDAEFLLDASGVLETAIHPIVVQSRGEQGQQTKDHALVSGTKKYRVPYRAAGIRQILIVQSDGRERMLDEFDPRQMTELGINQNNTGAPLWYTLERDYVVLYPTPGETATLRIRYYPTPNKLVGSAFIGVVTSKPAVNQVVVTIGASVGTTFNANAVVDLVRANPTFEHLDMDITITTNSGGGTPTLTFGANYNTDLEIGDQVCLAREAHVPQVPTSLHLPLALRSIGPALRAMGDHKLAKELEDEATALENSAKLLLSPRNAAATKDIADFTWFGGGRGR